MFRGSFIKQSFWLLHRFKHSSSIRQAFVSKVTYFIKKKLTVNFFCQINGLSKHKYIRVKGTVTTPFSGGLQLYREDLQFRIRKEAVLFLPRPLLVAATLFLIWYPASSGDHSRIWTWAPSYDRGADLSVICSH